MHACPHAYLSACFFMLRVVLLLLLLCSAHLTIIISLLSILSPAHLLPRLNTARRRSILHPFNVTLQGDHHPQEPSQRLARGHQAELASSVAKSSVSKRRGAGGCRSVVPLTVSCFCTSLVVFRRVPALSVRGVSLGHSLAATLLTLGRSTSRVNSGGAVSITVFVIFPSDLCLARFPTRSVSLMSCSAVLKVEVAEFLGRLLFARHLKLTVCRAGKLDTLRQSERLLPGFTGSCSVLCSAAWYVHRATTYTSSGACVGGFRWCWRR